MESAKGQQIQKKQIELDRKKLKLRMQAAQKKQVTAADTVVEKHDCAHNPKGKDCPVHGMDACPAKEMSEGKELSIDDQMRISREANAKRNHINLEIVKSNALLRSSKWRRMQQRIPERMHRR